MSKSGELEIEMLEKEIPTPLIDLERNRTEIILFEAARCASSIPGGAGFKSTSSRDPPLP